MQKHDAAFLLHEKIRSLEIECAEQAILLNEQFKLTIDSLKPINLIKDTLASPEIKTGAIDAAIGMTSGYFAKKMVVRSSHNPLVKLAGALLQIGVANVAMKNSGAIKSMGELILKKIFAKKESDSEKV